MKRAIKSHQQSRTTENLRLPEDHPGMEQPATEGCVAQVNRGIQILVDFHELKFFTLALIRSFLILSLRTRQKLQNYQHNDFGR